MIKYFTKEYIKECDCEEIRGLRPELNYGDWYRYSGEIFIVRPSFEFSNKEVRNMFTWLPTGSQLDEEIMGICQTRGGGYYEFNYQHRKYPNKYCFDFESKAELSGKEFNVKDSNPLIAKIKLLKELLK